MSKYKTVASVYNGGQKISSTTVIPLTYAVEQPLGMNNLPSHVDMCQSDCVYGFVAFFYSEKNSKIVAFDHQMCLADLFLIQAYDDRDKMFLGG
jgi:hypothetical protein